MELNDFIRALAKLLVKAREIQGLKDDRENPQKTIKLNQEARAVFPSDLAIYIYENLEAISNALQIFGFILKEKNESFRILNAKTRYILCEISTTEKGSCSFYAFPVSPA